MQILKITPRAFGANTYVLTSDGKTAVVIDPAQPRVESELIKLGLQAEYVLLTHCHFDHVGGVRALQEQGAKVFCSEREKPLIGTAGDLFDAFGAPRIPYRVDGTLKDGETREFCGISVTTLLTAGHTQGSVCYLVRDEQDKPYLFTGDTLFAGTIGRTDFPTGDLSELRKSLKKLSALSGDMPVYAGHEEDTTLERERKTNPFMIDA